MKKLFFLSILLLVLSGCVFLLIILLSVLSGRGDRTAEPPNWGSFTAEKTYSYDEQFYAIQSVEKEEDWSVRYIVVSIYLTEDDTFLCSFIPARARDFYGICWEKDTYNIWTQSADIGIYCYKYENGEWLLDESAVRPDYIISKYDHK